MRSFERLIERRLNMAITAIVSHEVKDFDTYKAGFDAHDNARTAAGII